MTKSWSRQAPTVLVGILLIGALFMNSAAVADHEPANKVAAAGSTIEALDPGTTAPVLQERVKVSSSFDVILSLTSECSILTALRTGDNPAISDNTDTANAFGQLTFFITIDGKRVPVTYTDEGNTDQPVSTDVAQPGREDSNGVGEVVFCNREYQRTMTDSEDQGTDGNDGIDTVEDFIRTRTANAFNWLARDVGFNYDDQCTVAAPGCFVVTPANGNNVVEIKVWARFFRRTDPACDAATSLPSSTADSCANGIVGRRTLIAEPTNASVHEWVQPSDATTGG